MIQEQLDKQKIEELEIYKKNKTKRAKICFIVAESLVLLMVLLTIIVLSIGALQRNDNIAAYVGFSILYVAVPLVGLLFIRVFNQKLEHPNKDSDKKRDYIFYLVVFCPPVRWIMGILLAGAATCGYMTGWYFGLACIPNFVGYIFIVCAFGDAKNKWKIQYAKDIEYHKQYLEKQKQIAQQETIEKQHEKELNTVIALLSKVGNKFFVKYYRELRDWSEPDILDVIQEDYTEETKLQRIRKAKEIFAKQLNKLALQRISDPSNKTVDEETRQQASNLLNQVK